MNVPLCDLFLVDCSYSCQTGLLGQRAHGQIRPELLLELAQRSAQAPGLIPRLAVDELFLKIKMTVIFAAIKWFDFMKMGIVCRTMSTRRPLLAACK